MSAGEAGRHVVGFPYFFIDVLLEVQNTRYSKILYLIDYLAYGLIYDTRSNYREAFNASSCRRLLKQVDGQCF